MCCHSCRKVALYQQGDDPCWSAENCGTYFVYSASTNASDPAAFNATGMRLL